MYSFLSKKYLYSAKLKKERRRIEGETKRKKRFSGLSHQLSRFSTLSWRVGKVGRKLQSLRANPVTNNSFFSTIDFAQGRNRKFVLLGSRFYSPSFKGEAGLADAMVNFLLDMSTFSPIEPHPCTQPNLQKTVWKIRK